MPTEAILLAEDEEMLRRVVARSLRESGYGVIEARDGSEALRLSAESGYPIQLLLTDIHMPDMDGRDLAKRLSSERPEMKILFISGYYKEAELDSGTEFLGKPFTPGELLGRVRALLGSQEQADAVAKRPPGSEHRQ